MNTPIGLVCNSSQALRAENCPEHLLNKIFSSVPENIKSYRLVNKHWHRSSYDAVKSLQLHALNELVGDFPNAVNLDLAKVKVQPSDEDLKHLQKLPNLKKINFYGCWKLTAIGLENLQFLTDLKALSLSSCPQISDVDVISLISLRQLTNLDLSHCSGLTDSTLAFLSHLSDMQRLNLSNCENIAFQPHSTNSLQTLTKITALILSNNYKANDQLVETLANLPSLQILDICKTTASLSALMQLSRLSQLTHLNASYRKSYSENNGVDFSLLKALQSLDLLGSYLKDEHLAFIADLKELTSLNITQNLISTQGINSLKKMTQLKELRAENALLHNINFIAFESFIGLSSLNIGNISDEQRERLICQLPNLAKLNGQILSQNSIAYYREYFSQKPMQSTKSISDVAQTFHSNSASKASSSKESSGSDSESLEIENFWAEETQRENSENISIALQSTPLNCDNGALNSEESARSSPTASEVENFSTDRKQQKKPRGFGSRIYTFFNNLFSGFLRWLGYA